MSLVFARFPGCGPSAVWFFPLSALLFESSVIYPLMNSGPLRFRHVCPAIRACYRFAREKTVSDFASLICRLILQSACVPESGRAILVRLSQVLHSSPPPFKCVSTFSAVTPAFDLFVLLGRERAGERKKMKEV